MYRGHEERRLQYIGQLFCGDGWRGGGVDGAVWWRKKVSIVGGAIENWLPAFGELNARNKQLETPDNRSKIF